MLRIFKNKRVLVTGHTGFKGAWLTTWLVLLGAKVLGISKNLPTKPSFYKELKISKNIIDLRFDIKDLNKLKKTVKKFKPDFIFHLAAQSLVNVSYKSPLMTWQTNLVGTINVLESIKFLKKKCVCVIITSDKCYRNYEVKKGYKETDELGGYDPYSASKGAAEIAVRSYIKSFFSNPKKYRIATARAGNVIGGGDWNKGRLIPDCIIAAQSGETAKIRNQNSTRPWQHVIELIYGYLKLSVTLKNNKLLHGESFNFGPNKQKNRKVKEVLDQINYRWNFFRWKKHKYKKLLNRESKLLKLNCEKSYKKLKWKLIMSFQETIQLTLDWYKYYYSKQKDIYGFTVSQINYYKKKLSNERY
tara:strand:- start:3643 stop:4719 length:1077 start_codon:yes stop_codon:yes gene_type:complete